MSICLPYTGGARRTRMRWDGARKGWEMWLGLIGFGTYCGFAPIELFDDYKVLTKERC